MRQLVVQQPRSERPRPRLALRRDRLQQGRQLSGQHPEVLPIADVQRVGAHGAQLQQRLCVRSGGQAPQALHQRAPGGLRGRAQDQHVDGVGVLLGQRVQHLGQRQGGKERLQQRLPAHLAHVLKARLERPARRLAAAPQLVHELAGPVVAALAGREAGAGGPLAEPLHALA